MKSCGGWLFIYLIIICYLLSYFYFFSPRPYVNLMRDLHLQHLAIKDMKNTTVRQPFTLNLCTPLKYLYSV